jgi:hypothetical protein
VPRKKRSDRNHVIYLITNLYTSETYIGITAAIRQAYLHSAKLRLKQHISDAATRIKNSRLHDSIRTYGSDGFTVEVIYVIRTKAAAHQLETELIRQFRPQLNIASNHD